MGGLATMARGIQKLAEEQGVQVMLNTESGRIVTERGRAVGVQARGADGAAVSLPCDAVLANADYAHVETELLTPADCSFPRRYWERRVVAPTLLLLYLGINRRLHGLLHHNLYFKPDWDGHFNAIFRRPAWPEEPCCNVSCISKTDPGMAPPGCENMFVLVPVAAGLDDTDEVREAYADRIIRHLERMTGEAIAPRRSAGSTATGITCRRYRWRARLWGWRIPRMKTAVFRPPCAAGKCGTCTRDSTHPGIGVPMVLMPRKWWRQHLRDHGG